MSPHFCFSISDGLLGFNAMYLVSLMMSAATEQLGLELLVFRKPWVL